jgi:hypothetical protein
MAEPGATHAAGINAPFAQALLDPDIAIPNGVSDPDGKQAPRRFAVYRNNVVASLMEALASVFPAVRAILGEENFSRVARNFVAVHPPRMPMMQAYGAGFPDFLESFPPLRSAPFLGDVARLERAFLDAFHAADEPCLSGEALAGLSPEETLALAFEPHAATFLFASSHPVVDLFAMREGRPERVPDLANAQCALITRPQFIVELREISAAQHDFLARLLRGAALGEAAGESLEAAPDFDLPGTLALAIAAGMFRHPSRRETE